MIPEISDISDDEIGRQEVQFEMFSDRKNTEATADIDSIYNKVMSKWKERGDEPNQNNLFTCPLVCFTKCCMQCSVTFRELCYYTLIGKLDRISHEAVKSLFSLNNVDDLCPKGRAQLSLKHLMSFIKIVVRVKAIAAAASLSIWNFEKRNFYPQNMVEFEDACVDFLMQQNYPLAINC